MNSNNSGGSLRAGVAKSDITTSQEGALINDPLYAKALVLDDGTNKVVIIAMDALAIGVIGDIKEDFLPKLRSRIEQELQIPGCHVLVNASHTHPPGRLLCDDDEQVDRTFDAVRRALQNMTEVKVGSGVGYEDRIMINRNLTLKNGKHWSIRYANPCPPDEEVAAVGPTDPDIGVIRIDRMDGQPFAVLYNFACHPLIGVPQRAVTANYPGFASKVIEETLGNDAMALFLQGAAGDVIEVLFKDVNRSRDSEPIGTMLGISTLNAIRDIETKDAKLSIISETIMLPRRTDIPQRIEALLEEQTRLLESLRTTCLNIKTFLPLYIKYALNPEYPSDYSYRYLQAEKIGDDALTTLDTENRNNLNKYLENIHTMERLTRIQENIVTLNFHKAMNDKADNAMMPAEVIGIKIGDCVLISAPAEVLVEVGLNVKKASPYKHTFMAAYSNGFLDYAPPVAQYDKGGYEVVECHLGPEWQQLYEEKADEIIRKL
ncbi:hypothetical protein [Paenibacillus eucommiae]|uniref:Neutral/alkaline non-lysosomal ceramidase N-terminal domain-containing protein n=1 Tax=Paenibacillus eucommiae TaxID=1355755 RepID=A0ABS4J9Z1_9BACL|nr:hypothetical protein [Paenibacillus eucommiae]MBP1996615.1 hypothetical protein [Paenibacillus eucommiae]